MNKIFCIFLVQSSKVLFVDSFDLKNDADVFCELMNDFRNGDYCRYIVRCLEQSEYDKIMIFLKDGRYKDVSSVYDPFISRIFVRA